MPCGCERIEEYTNQQNRVLADQATRAACDLRTILKRNCPNWHLMVTRETLYWVHRHDLVDEQRIAKEVARGEREAARQRALDKLNLDERRILGL